MHLYVSPCSRRHMWMPIPCPPVFMCTGLQYICTAHPYITDMHVLISTHEHHNPTTCVRLHKLWTPGLVFTLEAVMHIPTADQTYNSIAIGTEVSRVLSWLRQGMHVHCRPNGDCGRDVSGKRVLPRPSAGACARVHLITTSCQPADNPHVTQQHVHVVP